MILTAAGPKYVVLTAEYVVLTAERGVVLTAERGSNHKHCRTWTGGRVLLGTAGPNVVLTAERGSKCKKYYKKI